jgi:hypothetical protein
MNINFHSIIVEPEIFARHAAYPFVKAPVKS